MGQSAPIKTNDAPDCADALSWARIAGLVQINPNGSWQLTPEGLSGMLKLLGQAHPYVAPSVGEAREVEQPEERDQPLVSYTIHARRYAEAKGRFTAWPQAELSRPDGEGALHALAPRVLRSELVA